MTTRSRRLMISNNRHSGETMCSPFECYTQHPAERRRGFSLAWSQLLQCLMSRRTHTGICVVSCNLDVFPLFSANILRGHDLARREGAAASCEPPRGRAWRRSIIGRSVMPRIVFTLLGDLLQWLARGMRSHTRLAAENLFLRKQLAFYVERWIKPRRLDDATRLTLGFSPASSSGEASSRSSNRRRSCDGTDRAFGCSGGGSHTGVGVRRFPSTSRR
jgi:hypothetical protein